MSKADETSLERMWSVCGAYVERMWSAFEKEFKSGLKSVCTLLDLTQTPLNGLLGSYYQIILLHFSGVGKVINLIIIISPFI
jgi:hypothetical protein